MTTVTAVTTTERTVTPGAALNLGWRELVHAPGEDHAGAPVHPAARTLLALVHLSDLHLCDAESPARQEYLDRHGDPGAPYAGRLGLIGTYRPQEVLTVQVAVSALQAMHRLDAAPVTGAPFDAVLVTGDVTDNAQRNELSWYATVMAGGRVEPWSGARDRSSWVGAVDGGVWSEHFWHPDGPWDGMPADLPTARYGYPTVPGLIEAARGAVPSPGAGLPWLTVHGNHDALLQGVVPVDAALLALAVGSERVVDLGRTQTPLVALEATAPVGPARYTHDSSSPVTPVVSDPRREITTVDDFVVATSGGTSDRTPGSPGARAGRTYWARDVGEVRLVALDTVNPYGGWQGSLDTPQLAWLEAELDRSRGRYVIVTSHHPSWALSNGYAPPGATRRHLGDEVLAVLLRHPEVVAWVAGHVHAHTHLWHQAPDRAGGLWEVTTSSLIDWPQQLRTLELVREPDGTLVLASTVLDHVAPTSWDAMALDEVPNLAALSRALAANDYRGRSGRRAAAAGRPTDRNALWRLPDPFA